MYNKENQTVIASVIDLQDLRAARLFENDRNSMRCRQ